MAWRDWKKINQAIEGGAVRKIGERAGPDQVLAYILSDKKFFHHANLRSAKAEKEFLQGALGKQMRIYKVWNVSRKGIITDMELLRSDLNKSKNWGDTQQAIDRILSGAGY